MSGGFTILLRRIFIVVVSPLLLVTVLAIVLLGTEFGTRWTLRQAIRFAPGELTVPEFHGTLLRGLEVPQLRYADESMQISASEIYIGIDWFRSSLNHALLRQLSAGEVSYRSLAAPAAEPGPLEIAMPELPIRVGASNIRIGSLLVRDHAISDIVIEKFDIRGNALSADSASASLDAIALTVRGLDGRLAGEVPVAATFAWQYGEGEWSGEGRIRGSLAELGFEHTLEGAYAASASGTLFLLHRTDPEFDANVRFDRWMFGETGVESGEVRIRGTASAYRAEVDFELGYRQSLSAAIAGAVTGNLSGLDAIDVTANGPAGQLAVGGSLVWLPDFFAALEIRARELDPSLVSTLETGKLDADVRVRGSGPESFALHIDSLTGSYGGAAASAQGSMTRNAADWACTLCTLSLGPNRVALDGELADQQLSAQLDARAPALGLFWPGVTGALEADLRIRGAVALPMLSGRASGTNLEWGRWSAAAFTVTSRSSTLEKVDLDARVEGLFLDDVVIGSGTGRINGEVRAIDAEIQWSRGDVDTSIEATVTAGDDAMAAQVRSASIKEPFAGTWQLAAPTRLSMGPKSLEVAPHAWSNGEAALNVTALSMLEGRIAADGTLVAMPLATLNVALPDNVRLQGYADGELRVNRNADGELTGGMRWAQRDTVVRISPPRDAPIDIRVPVATADVTVAGAGLSGTANLEIEPGVRGSLEFALERFAADSPVTARLRFAGSEWGWIPAFFPEIDNFRADITTDISASGSLAAPELAGELRWSKGRLDVPALNVPLEEIEVSVTGSSAGSATIAGSAKAGGGSLSIEGTFDDLMRQSRSFRVRMKGREATVMNWPDYQLAASPDLVFTGSAAGVAANGSISVDKAEISVSELPEGAVSPSDDVTVSGREVEPPESFAVSGAVDVVLSENVHISAFGLDTNVEGQLTFTLPEDREPRANGTLKLVDGVFAAYGQRLTIEEGTMTFTGPLDDPVIFVRAVREIESLSGTIKAGIELRGRAQNLSSSVFSSPTMSEADALSYLILGRPLEDATAADGSMLSGTAYSLGMRQATVITNQIGQTLGLDQLTVAGNSQSTTALVAGKQLSSRVYVRYAYGVFSQVGNLLLRYKLSKRLTIEAGTGESQSMDLLYIVEKP